MRLQRQGSEIISYSYADTKSIPDVFPLSNLTHQRQTRSKFTKPKRGIQNPKKFKRKILLVPGAHKLIRSVVVGAAPTGIN